MLADKLRWLASRLPDSRGLPAFRRSRRAYALAFCVAVGAFYGCRTANDVCLEQEISGSAGCTQRLGFAVSECNNCVEIAGCECVGADCADIFSSRTECEEFVGGASCHCK